MKSLLTNRAIQKYVFIWFIFWFSVMGTNIFLLKPMGYNFLHNFEYITAYFLFFSIFGYFLMKKVGEGASMKNSSKQVVITFLSTSLFCIISVAMKDLLPIPPEQELFIEKQGFYYPLLLWSTSIGKVADIIFQQTLIVSLVLFLKNNVRRPREVVEAFTIIFFILHIPLFLEFGLMALIFIIPSLFAGAIFSFLITFYSWGVLGSMLVHQYYYIAMAIIIRLLYKA